MKIFKWFHKRIKSGSERGISLVEAAVAVFLLGGGVLTMVMSMSGGALAVNTDDQEVTAQALARTQLEYVKEYPFVVNALTYPAVDVPAGYTVNVSVAAVPDTNENIQKITATIIRDGSTVLALQDYKVNR
jgi:Tfp pilus assembly protein PilV